MPSTTSAAGGRTPDPAGQAGSSDDAGQDDERRQHCVVRHHSAEEPRQCGEQVFGAQPQQRDGPVCRGGEARDTEDHAGGHHGDMAGHACTSRRETHLVCSTPGRFGAMIRQG